MNAGYYVVAFKKGLNVETLYAETTDEANVHCASYLLQGFNSVVFREDEYEEYKSKVRK